MGVGREQGRGDVPYIWIRIWMWFSEGCGTLSRREIEDVRIWVYKTQQ
jgi:hypothetical protein